MLVAVASFIKVGRGKGLKFQWSASAYGHFPGHNMSTNNLKKLIWVEAISENKQNSCLTIKRFVCVLGLMTKIVVSEKALLENGKYREVLTKDRGS